MNSSHVYAEQLKTLAEFLLSKPEFEVNSNKAYFFDTYYNRDSFIKAVKALGSGTKNFTDTYLEYLVKSPNGTHIRIEAPRDRVCTLVTPAVYDCIPLLSEEEVEAL